MGILDIPALPRQLADKLYARNGANADTNSLVGDDGILVIGQSNASGRGTEFTVTVATVGNTGYNIVTDPPDARIYQWPSSGAYAGQRIPAVDPLGHADFADASSTLGLGPGLPFAREWVRRAPAYRTPVLIPGAYGGTAFEGVDSHGTTRQWKVGATGNTQNLYESSIAQAQAFLALNPANTIVAALWIQGEQDASNSTSQATYQTDLDALIAGLRTRLSVPNLPFIVGPMTPETVASGPTRAAINAAHIDTPVRNSYTGFAYGLSSGNTDPVNGTLHWNAKAQRAFGPAMYAAYLRALTNVTGTAPVSLTSAPTFKQTSNTAGTISWVYGSGRATAYVVEINNNGAGWTTVTRTPSAALDAVQPVTGLTAGGTVQTRVSVVNEQGTSAASPVGSATLGYIPGNPGTPVLSFKTNTTANLSTTAPTVDSTHGAAVTYTWYRSTDGTNYSSIATGVTTLTYQATGLTAGTAYWFKVAAVGAAGFGGTSGVLTFTTGATGPFLVDTFTGTAGTVLGSHTPDTGGAWTVAAGGMGLSDVNRLRSSSATSTLALNAATPPGTDYSVSVDFPVLSLVTGTSKGVYIRASGTSTANMSGYGVRYVVASAAWQLLKFVSGTSTVLASFAATPAPGDVHTITVTVAGTTISGTVDGVQPSGWSVTDSSVTAAGGVGFICTGTADTNTAGIHADNLQAA